MALSPLRVYSVGRCRRKASLGLYCLPFCTACLFFVFTFARVMSLGIMSIRSLKRLFCSALHGHWLPPAQKLVCCHSHAGGRHFTRQTWRERGLLGVLVVPPHVDVGNLVCFVGGQSGRQAAGAAVPGDAVSLPRDFLRLYQSATICMSGDVEGRRARCRGMFFVFYFVASLYYDDD